MTDHPQVPGSTLLPDPGCRDVLEEIRRERIRAHEKHGDTSMESLDAADLTRLTVLMEEVGEVACEFNEARHYGFLDTPCLRAELIQVAAMAAAWADALTHPMQEPPHIHVDCDAATTVTRSTTDGSPTSNSYSTTEAL